LNHRRSSAFIGGFMAVACAVAAAQPVSVVDDRGKTVSLARPAQRFVTLAPSLTELAIAAGAGSRLVGVARLSRLPHGAHDIPFVGDALRVDLERIVALKPDLVLAWRSGNSVADIGRLEQLGVPVWVSEPSRLADVPRHLRAIGALAATRTAAEAAASAHERDIAELRARYASARKVRVFYVIWHKPLMTVSGEHLIGDVMALCGGENVFAGLPQLSPTVSLEAVIAAKPEAILGGGSAGGEQAFVERWRATAVPPLRGLPLYYVDPDRIQQATPRIVEGARTVCAALDTVRRQRG
jgi:iron complex transport system substrate-binding protein